jgi:predicted metal-dependent hydrolase
MAKFADLERETEAANARADAAEERARAAEERLENGWSEASAVTKDARAREAQARQLIATATDATQRATRLERMLRQAMWRDTLLVYLPAVTKTSMVTPEEAVDFARRAADAAAKLEPQPTRAEEELERLTKASTFVDGLRKPVTHVYGAQQEGTASRADEDEATRNA